MDDSDALDELTGLDEADDSNDPTLGDDDPLGAADLSLGSDGTSAAPQNNAVTANGPSSHRQRASPACSTTRSARSASPPTTR